MSSKHNALIGPLGGCPVRTNGPPSSDISGKADGEDSHGGSGRCSGVGHTSGTGAGDGAGDATGGGYASGDGGCAVFMPSRDGRERLW
jgi:hypothetical protein